MVGHGGSSASYLAGPTSPIPSHCALIVATSTVRVNITHHFSSDAEFTNIVARSMGQSGVKTKCGVRTVMGQMSVSFLRSSIKKVALLSLCGVL